MCHWFMDVTLFEGNTCVDVVSGCATGSIGVGHIGCMQNSVI